MTNCICETGFMYWDGGNSSVASRIVELYKRHLEKGREKPTTCYVHPSLFAEIEDQSILPVTVKEDKYIMKNFFWFIK